MNWKVVERWAKGCQGVYPEDVSLMDVMGNNIEGRDVEPWQSNACNSGQWPCEYLDACWTYDLDREKMKAGGLVQVQRLNKQTLASSQEDQQGGAVL